jgi:hypothetical protein
MISSQLLLDEIAGAQSILAKWHERVSAGIPGLDLPASTEDAAVSFYDELSSELLVSAGKIENLAHVVRGDW